MQIRFMSQLGDPGCNRSTRVKSLHAFHGREVGGHSSKLRQRDALSEYLLKALKEEKSSSLFRATQCYTELLNSGSSQELKRLFDLEITVQPTLRLGLSNKTASRAKEFVSHHMRRMS